MSNPFLRLSGPRPVARWKHPALPVGRQLVNAGLIDQATLLRALATQRRVNAPLGEILVAEGHVARSDVHRALAIQHDADVVNLGRNPPASTMASAISADICQAFGVVPWRWMGNILLVATSRPDLLGTLADALPTDAPAMLPVIASQEQISRQIGILHASELALKAVTKVPERLSCRSWSVRARSGKLRFGGVVVAALAFGFAFPAWFVTILMGFAVITLSMTITLKALAVGAMVAVRVPCLLYTSPSPRDRG